MATSETRFGKYHLGAKIARGGMAEIYRGRFEPRPGVSKPVIIKRILPSFAADPHFIEMFANEAKIAMGLSHGNVAQVFDFGNVDGAWFLAMELVDGPSLSQVFKRSRALGIPHVPAPLAALIIAETLKGLHYAHTRRDERGALLGIVHRDVSPQNVLVSYEGQVKLVDFGIAKARSATNKTRAGIIKGKYLYFSPEQIREQALDGRTDVFAAGTLLYQLLTGTLPFDGEMVEVMRNIAQGRFAPPRERNPEIPPALEQIVLQAMAPALEDRYRSAGEFGQALSSWLHANAPGDFGGRLGQFISYLFAPELEAQGRPAQLDPALVDEFESWRRAEPVPEAGTDPGTRADRGQKTGPRRRSTTGLGATRPSEVGAGPRKRRVPALVLVAAPLLLVLGGLAAAVLLAEAPSFSLQVTSEPSGASVRVDGKPIAGKSPLTAPGLLADLPHLVQVDLPGMKPWQLEARGQPGAVTRLHATLVRERPAPPAPVAEADAGAPAPPDPALLLPTEARWPVGAVTVHARRHALLVPQSAAARLDLDPERSYQVWVEGRVSYGGLFTDVWVNECVLFLEGSQVKAHQAFSVLGRKPVTITGAERLYAFVNDTEKVHNSGALRLRVKTAGQPLKTVLIDAVTHMVMPPENQRMTVSNLNTLAHYALTVKAGTPAPRTRREGTPGRVMFGIVSGLINASTEEQVLKPQRVLEPGKRYEFSGTPTIWFYFPDDDLSDNEGSVEVEVEQIGQVLDLIDADGRYRQRKLK